MFRVVGLGGMRRVPKGVDVPAEIAPVLGARAARAPAEGGSLGLIGGPEPGDPRLQAVERWAREAGVELRIEWGEPIGRVVGPSGASAVFTGPVAPGSIGLLPVGPIRPQAHALFDPGEELLFFADVREEGERATARALEGRVAGPLAAFFRPDRDDGRALLEARTTMSALLREGGCPWDRAQDHLTLRRYLLEEAGEAVDALTSGDVYKSREELGDLLLQILFHSLLFEREDRFGFADVAHTLSDKLRRRHPHVFGEESARDPGAVARLWESVKRAEEGGERPITDEVPAASGVLEATARALRVMDRLHLELPEMAVTGEALARAAQGLARGGEDPAVALRLVLGGILAGLGEAEAEAKRRGVDAGALAAPALQGAFGKGLDSFLSRKKED